MLSDVGLTTPVLFLVFNRPYATRQVFEKIREARPAYLFLASDGARPHAEGEKEKCEEVRRIIQDIDWPCKVETLFRDKNIGCKVAVSSGIDWFFENVEEGIILEDDCVPSRSFFSFCQALLEYFRDDSRIMMVSGLNVLGEWKSNSQDYHFGLGGTWGWASWRRAWDYFDVDMKLWSRPDAKTHLRHFLADEELYTNMVEVIDRVYNNELDTWDYQWAFARFINSGLSVNPSRNLVRNVGFGADATHTHAPRPQLPLYEMRFPLRHNEFVVVDRDYERMILDASWLTKRRNKRNPIDVVKAFARRMLRR
jgi:hypothetical protein